MAKKNNKNNRKSNKNKGFAQNKNIQNEPNLLDLTRALIEEFVDTSALATFCSMPEERAYQITIERDGADCVWGRGWDYTPLFFAKLVNSERAPWGVTLRTPLHNQFAKVLDENGKKQIVQKDGIRMFLISEEGYHQLTPAEAFACHNTDPRTGEPLPRDPAVEYLD